ncbi:6910_t:CDS:1, partial [Racocetra persica]
MPPRCCISKKKTLKRPNIQYWQQYNIQNKQNIEEKKVKSNGVLEETVFEKGLVALFKKNQMPKAPDILEPELIDITEPGLIDITEPKIQIIGKIKTQNHFNNPRRLVNR